MLFPECSNYVRETQLYRPRAEICPSHGVALTSELDIYAGCHACWFGFFSCGLHVVVVKSSSTGTWYSETAMPKGWQQVPSIVFGCLESCEGSCNLHFVRAGIFGVRAFQRDARGIPGTCPPPQTIWGRAGRVVRNPKCCVFVLFGFLYFRCTFTLSFFDCRCLWSGGCLFGVDAPLG